MPGLAEKSVVISLQNGIENESLLSKILGAERVAAGAAYVEATLNGPGSINHRRLSRLAIATTTESGRPVPQLEEFKQLSEAAGLVCELASDSLTLKWSKLIFISAFSGWTTATARSVDQVLAEPELREAFKATLLETANVARAAGAKVNPEETLKGVLELAQKLGDMRSSMQFDLESGKRLEVEALNGAVVRTGRELGVPTPYNQALLALLTAIGPE